MVQLQRKHKSLSTPLSEPHSWEMYILLSCLCEMCCYQCPARIHDSLLKLWHRLDFRRAFIIFESSVFIYESNKMFCESSIEGYFVLLGWKCRWLSELARGWLLVCTVSPPGIARLQCTGHCNSHNVPQPTALSAESEYCMLFACWRTYCRGYYFYCNVNEPTNHLHGIVLEKITVPQLVNEFCIFCRTHRFITACPYPEPDESRPICPILPCKIHINIILPSTFVS